VAFGRWKRWIIAISAAAIALCLVVAYKNPTSGASRRGRESYRSGAWNKAGEEARLFLKKSPDDSEALRILARSSARLGKDETAEAIYRRLGTGRMQAEDLFLLGRGLLERGQKGPGLAALGAARDLDPDHPETLNILIRYHRENETLSLAVADAERLMRRPEWNVRGMAILASLRRELFEPAAAADLLVEVLRRESDLPSAGTDLRQLRRLLSLCLLESNRPREAGIQLAQVLEFGPDAELSWLLSRARLMEGKVAEAKAALAESGEFAHNDPLRHEPASYVGASRCMGCHPREFRSQQQSRHARTIVAGTVISSLPWPDEPLVDRANPHVTHRLRRVNDRLEATTQFEDQSFTALIQYALGSNHQGRSFVARDGQGQARELRISQYPAAPEWDRTSEHPSEPPGPDGYLGRPISEDSVRRCLHCHSTNFRAVQAPTGRPEASDHGIGCERCHGPGGHHLQAIDRQFPDLAIARPKLASAAQIVSLCGQCHKAPESASPAKASYIRFQAPTFVQSRCYTEAGTMSCVTCHNPHRDASRDPAHYEAICLQCHPTPGSSLKSSGEKQAQVMSWAPCPTGARRDCLGCHMRKVAEAVPRTIFTDHHIRIQKVTDPTKNGPGAAAGFEE
jgi:hypothetical protein